MKNSRADSVFQGKRRLFKLLKDKKYIQYGEFRAHSVFQGKHKLLKNPVCKNYIQYSEKFQGKLFSEQAQVTQKSSFQCSEHFQGRL